MTNLRSSYADMLVNLLLAKKYQLYVDLQNKPLIVHPSSPHIARPIRSQDTIGILAKMHWEFLKKSIQKHTLDAAINTLEGLAIAKCKRVEVFNRVAMANNTIYYDIGDDQHIVKINAKGWTIDTNAPVLFRRYKHQLPQVLPIKGGKLSNVAKYFNISNETQKILLITYLPVALIPNIARQLLIIHGPQGAGKSTALSLIRSLLDPSVIPLLTPTSKTEEIVREADHNYCFYLDNISGINTKMSDSLCRLVSGVSFTKRELYTDDEDVIYSFKRAVAINGVAQCASKPDLLDRSLIIQLDRISENKRQLENFLKEDFNENKPKILGAIFDTVSGILRDMNKLDKSKLELPRMADYYLCAITASEYLDIGAESFIKAYQQNINDQNQEALNSSLIGILILEFMSKVKGDEWSGSAAELLTRFINSAGDLKNTPGFPKSPLWIWRMIQEARTTLEAVGIVAMHNDSDRPRKIIFRKTSKFQPIIPELMHESPLDEHDNELSTEELQKLIHMGTKNTPRNQEAQEVVNKEV